MSLLEGPCRGKKGIGEVRFDAVWPLGLASVSSESDVESNCSPKKRNQVP